jgi:DNA (cytosine-5)-methyltransferase 1
MGGAGRNSPHRPNQIIQRNLFDVQYPIVKVKDIIETIVDSKYHVSAEFERQLFDAVDGKLENLDGVRLIDFRGGNSLHSWDLGIKGKCTPDERDFMNALIAHRRLKKFGNHQDGKSLTIEQIKTFFDLENIELIIDKLIEKKYLKK